MACFRAITTPRTSALRSTPMAQHTPHTQHPTHTERRQPPGEKTRRNNNPITTCDVMRRMKWARPAAEQHTHEVRAKSPTQAARCTRHVFLKTKREQDANNRTHTHTHAHAHTQTRTFFSGPALLYTGHDAIFRLAGRYLCLPFLCFLRDNGLILFHICT